MTGWAVLDEELGRWADLDWRCPVWLRDDDAVAATPALDRLLRLCEAAGVPLGLAVIAAHATPSLAEPFDRAGGRTGRVAMLVHGWAHDNHASPGDKKSEFGPDRPADARQADAGRALARLRGLFGDHVLSLFVPPWNRMAADMPGVLVAAGYRAASGFGHRPTVRSPGLCWINTHVDLIDWRSSRSAVALEPLLDVLCHHLRVRRERSQGDCHGPIEPIGLLTHHRVHDAAIWRLLEALLDRLTTHPALFWPSVPDMMGAPAFPIRGPIRGA